MRLAATWAGTRCDESLARDEADGLRAVTVYEESNECSTMTFLVYLC